jgi:hypothetical protein
MVSVLMSSFHSVGVIFPHYIRFRIDCGFGTFRFSSSSPRHKITFISKSKVHCFHKQFSALGLLIGTSTKKRVAFSSLLLSRLPVLASLSQSAQARLWATVFALPARG